MKDKKIDDNKVEFVSDEEAILMKNIDYMEMQIKQNEDQIKANKVVIPALKAELKKLKKQNGNSK